MIFSTWFLLRADISKYVIIILISLAGAPLSSVSVVSYSFVAEVTYPVNEVFGVGLMNTFNKLFTFGTILVCSIYELDQLLVWTALSVLAIVPAIFVKEDLRRLKMKDVEKSEYIEEKQILSKPLVERDRLFRNVTVIVHRQIL